MQKTKWQVGELIRLTAVAFRYHNRSAMITKIYTNHQTRQQTATIMFSDGEVLGPMPVGFFVKTDIKKASNK